MRPLIGITASLTREGDKTELKEGYYSAVFAAGGIPVMLPPVGDPDYTAQLAISLDGIILSGGVDVDPIHFGEPVFKDTEEISPERDEFEIALTLAAIGAGTPIFGICRGIQVLNVAAGGTLFQDIYSGNPDSNVLKHSQEAPRWYGTHPVKIAPGSRLERIMGVSYLQVNSFHHQAVKEPAKNFEITATSPDGIIEAMEWKGPEFIMGVQWHPEAMWRRNVLFLNLFSALIKEAAKAGTRKRGDKKECLWELLK
jgi:putative glutamine amidotransferase